jgi:hypothetical protein
VSSLQRIEIPEDLTPFTEMDYRALRLITERTDCSKLKRDVLLRNMAARYKEGMLFKGREPTSQKWRMCEARFMMGDFSDWDGWQYRDPWSTGMWHNSKTVIPDSKPWNGLKTPHLYIIGEQGVGDEIFFGQCVPLCLLIADKVTFEGDPRLEKAFLRMGVHEFVHSNYVMNGDEKKRTMLEIKADSWMPLADLPKCFCTMRRVDNGERFTDPPFASEYIVADPLQVKKYEEYKGRIGISWRGAQGHYKAREFAKALSLQYDQSPLERVVRPQLDLKDDLEGVLGLLANLERVVTVSTTVAHLASAMGKPVDVILAPMNGRHKNALPFRWGLGGGKASHWYPSSRVYSGLNEYMSMTRRKNERRNELSQARV